LRLIYFGCHFNLTINVPVVYMGRDEMILRWTTSISRAIGRGGP